MEEDVQGVNKICVYIVSVLYACWTT